ncbi:glycosyltransferase [Planococcus lenghuensis]|uniref:N-acetylglucosaminyltransferase n=1 Tax=Planococcus lenghuensis TaxID=2213202 RepID=A0A1Q2L0N9_9BACL|nr:glycosyltransferase [Planococcus lenghuensis]AQQ54025.1 N-acetylglucosaminyltransferase [Planococcus lenghuensis]
MSHAITIILGFFWLLLLYYSVLTIAGIWYRARTGDSSKLENYPSVSVLIPAHNEGLVLDATLQAMNRLRYSGRLDVYVLDDRSEDDTAAIAQEYAAVFSRIHYIPVPEGAPNGKSRVLNYGISLISSDYFMVFDADNEPETDALEKLVQAAERTPDAAGAVGYVKTRNSGANVLTRMIGLEFQVFQLLMQCGRWALFKLGSLAGTNMLLRRSAIEEMGGYDVYALAEDAELTVRLNAAGYRLPVVPTSRTWEQEPETINALIRQRTRWLTGNIYLLEKSFREWSLWKGKGFIFSLQHVFTYLVFVLMLLLSDLFFIFGITGYELPHMNTPVLMLWFLTYVVYVGQLLSALVVDKNVSLKNVLLALTMYFTYAQLFLLLLFRSFVLYVWSRIQNEAIAWDKTQRFGPELEEKLKKDPL